MCSETNGHRIHRLQSIMPNRERKQKKTHIKSAANDIDIIMPHKLHKDAPLRRIAKRHICQCRSAAYVKIVLTGGDNRVPLGPDHRDDAESTSSAPIIGSTMMCDLSWLGCLPRPIRLSAVRPASVGAVQGINALGLKMADDHEPHLVHTTKFVGGDVRSTTQ